MFPAIKSEIVLSSALKKVVSAFISYHNPILDNLIFSMGLFLYEFFWKLKTRGEKEWKKLTYWSKQGTCE